MFGTFTIQGRDKAEEFLVDRPPSTWAVRGTTISPCPMPPSLCTTRAYWQTPSGCRIMDLGSSNGTFVNGVELPVKVEEALHDGDVVQVGPFQLRFRAQPSSGRRRSSHG